MYNMDIREQICLYLRHNLRNQHYAKSTTKTTDLPAELQIMPSIGPLSQQEIIDLYADWPLDRILAEQATFIEAEEYEIARALQQLIDAKQKS